jgi:hypothetical protein
MARRRWARDADGRDARRRCRRWPTFRVWTPAPSKCMSRWASTSGFRRLMTNRLKSPTTCIGPAFPGVQDGAEQWVRLCSKVRVPGAIRGSHELWPL